MAAEAARNERRFIRSHCLRLDVLGFMVSRRRMAPGRAPGQRMQDPCSSRRFLRCQYCPNRPPRANRSGLVSPTRPRSTAGFPWRTNDARCGRASFVADVLTAVPIRAGQVDRARLFLIVIIGIGLYHLLAWLAGAGEGLAENALGPAAHGPLAVLAFVLTIAASLGVVVGSVFLMPAVTALVASFFVDDIALEVERSRYPGEPAGRPLPLSRAIIEGVKTALLAIVVYLVALPFLLFAGFGAVIFFFCTAYILGREYFELAAMRYRPVAEAKALRKQHAARSSWPACSSRPSCRSRSSTWRPRCSAWRSWCTCTSACRAGAAADRGAARRRMTLPSA